MTFSEAVKTCLVDKYATLLGRATRSELWWFFFFKCLLALFCFLLVPLANKFLCWLILFIAILLILPEYAAMVRRLHDTGRSGWWIFIQCIPYLGTIILFILLCLPSDGDNKYGSKLQ
ncbi:MAG: DUF805 domain-containing protein [Bacteroides sp.]|nr:DUF805 domain-containing protein [Bacteroides sp.]